MDDKFTHKIVKKLLGWYIEPCKANIDALSKRTKWTEEQLTEHLEQLNKQQAQIKDNQEKNESYREPLNSLKNQICLHQEQLSVHQEQMNSHQEQLDAHQEQLNAHQDQMNSHQEQLNAHQDQMNSHQEQLNAHQDQMNSHQEQLNAHQEQFNSHQNQLNMHQTQFNSHQTQLNSHQQQINATAEKIELLRLAESGEKGFYPSFSQSGEDCIVQYVLTSLNIHPGSIKYLDLGANHAKEISNTYTLYKQGARGILLEANPQLVSELILYREGDVIIRKCLVEESSNETIPFYILNGDGLSSFDKKSVDEAIKQNPSLKIESVEQVQTITMNEIIDLYCPEAPVLLNIDIEGSEEQILKAIDFSNWRPFIIILETIPYHPYLVYDEKREDLVHFLSQKGYTEYAFTGINSILLDKERLDRKKNS